jgi:hypothetical protein
MTNLAHELVGWTDERRTVIQDSLDKALARTAKCRQVVPKGPDQIGEKAVVVPTLVAGPPLAYGADTIASPVHLFVDVRLDDKHADTEQDILRLVEAGAADLGIREDEEVVTGAPAGGAAAPGRVQRNAVLARGRLGRAPGAVAGAAGETQIGAGGALPSGQQVMAAIAAAVAALEAANRPGPCGLLLHNTILAALRVPAVAGAAPLIQQVEQLIGSSEIAGTGALDGSLAAGQVCGVLFRLDPAAVDLVHTQQPNLTVLGRANAQANLRIEEEIVLRVMDQTAVHHIEY